MKKYIRMSVVLVLFLFLCTGCNGTVTRNIRHAGFSVGGQFVCSNFFPQNKKDVNYEKITYLTDTHIINSEGKIYEVSLGQVFANRQNCKEAVTDIRVDAIMDNKVIRATDGLFYYLVGQNDVLSYSEVLNTDNSYPIYSILLGDQEVVKVITANSGTGLYYVLKTDGNVYMVTLNRADYNSPLVVRSVQLVYDKTQFGSDIVDFNYAGNSSATFVRTTDKIYRMIVQNAAECGSFADIQCIYEMQEDTLLNEYLDRMIVYNGKTIITDYQQIFSAAS